MTAEQQNNASVSSDQAIKKQIAEKWQQHGSHIYGPDPERRLVCQLHFDGNDDDAKYHAVLLAAPEMLDALKRADEALENAYGIVGPETPSSAVARDMAAVKIAIAKAEGTA